MLSKFKKKLIDAFKEPEASTDDSHSLELATAVLLVEIAKADADHGAEEQQQAIESLCAQYHLSDTEVNELLVLATQKSDDAISLYEFTDAINTGSTAAQRKQIILLLWQVAFADGVLDKLEDYTIRKISDLLHVPHSSFIETKLIASGEFN